MKDILLLGRYGYIGSAFAVEMVRRGIDFNWIRRSQVNYSDFETLVRYLQKNKPGFVINAAGFVAMPNVDAAENQKAEVLIGDLLLPHTIAHACALTQTPWGHVSSGCVYHGDGPELGFSEEDEPNFSFRSLPCSFYSGTKALAEEVVGECYIWRLRLPFDEFDHPRNYLTKLQAYDRVYKAVNSLSHRGDFAKACLGLIEANAPFGIYNITNPGCLSSVAVVGEIKRILRPDKEFKFWSDDQSFYALGASTPRSNCVLDTTKLMRWVKMRPVEEALESAIKNWVPEK